MGLDRLFFSLLARIWILLEFCFHCSNCEIFIILIFRFQVPQHPNHQRFVLQRCQDHQSVQLITVTLKMILEHQVQSFIFTIDSLRQQCFFLFLDTPVQNPYSPIFRHRMAHKIQHKFVFDVLCMVFVFVVMLPLA